MRIHRRHLAALLCAVAMSSACSSGPNEAAVSETVGSESIGSETASADSSTATTAQPTTSTPTAAPETSTTVQADSSKEPEEPLTVAQLRTSLGAARLIARSDNVVVAVSENTEQQLSNEFPDPYRDYIVVGGDSIVGYDGTDVCPSFELLGDFQVVDNVETVDGSVTVTIEDRRAFASEVGSEPVSIPRWSYNCDLGETVQLLSTTTVESQDDVLIVRSAVTPPQESSSLNLVAEYGLGDSPLRLSTAAGMLLIDSDQRAFDYVLSADGSAVYFTTYSGTGASDPPNGVVAVDTETGTERWRLPIGGYVMNFGDQLVVEAVDTSTMDTFGYFPGREVLLIDPATGTEVDRFPFTGRLINVF